MLHKLEQELAEERRRIEKRRDEGRRMDNDRLERIERDIHDMRNLMFTALQKTDLDLQALITRDGVPRRADRF